MAEIAARQGLEKAGSKQWTYRYIQEATGMQRTKELDHVLIGEGRRYMPKELLGKKS